jgi:hypothetical protein
MNRTGLVTLSDVPSLGGKSKRPTKTITIARLDNNLEHPRYGAFSITQKEVDSWKRNLAEVIGGDSWKRNLAGVMGGQVSIDADHSSDRGQGTRAMGSMTSINRDGKHLSPTVS